MMDDILKSISDRRIIDGKVYAVEARGFVPISADPQNFAEIRCAHLAEIDATAEDREAIAAGKRVTKHIKEIEK